MFVAFPCRKGGVHFSGNAPALTNAVAAAVASAVAGSAQNSCALWSARTEFLALSYFRTENRCPLFLKMLRGWDHAAQHKRAPKQRAPQPRAPGRYRLS